MGIDAPELKIAFGLLCFVGWWVFGNVSPAPKANINSKQNCKQGVMCSTETGQAGIRFCHGIPDGMDGALIKLAKSSQARGQLAELKANNLLNKLTTVGYSK